MSLNSIGHKPIYLQLVELFSQLIAGGDWLRDASCQVRDLAMPMASIRIHRRELSGELEREGLMYYRETNGQFITEDHSGSTVSDSRSAQDRSNSSFSRCLRWLQQG